MILTSKRWTALRAGNAQAVAKIVEDPEAVLFINEMRSMCSMPIPQTVEEKAELIDAFFEMCPTKRITVESVNL